MAGKMQLMSRFALLLVHIALLAALVDASSLHSKRHGVGAHRMLVRRAPAPAPLSPNAPQCPKRNYWKKLREAQALEAGGDLPGGQNNGTATLSSDAASATPAPEGASSTSVAVSSASEAESSSKASSEKPSATSSSAAPAKTSSSSSTPIKGSLGQLFPVGSSGRSWTTAPESENALSLSDGTLQPFSILRSVPYKFTSAPDGKRALQAEYPKGSYTFTHSPQGGFSFYAKGPDSVDLTKAKEATFGYRIYFPAGFAFNKGGKLPGFCALFSLPLAP